MNLMGETTYDEYANAPDQSDTSPDLNNGGVGALPAIWIVAVILVLVAFRFAQPYIEKML